MKLVKRQRVMPISVELSRTIGTKEQFTIFIELGVSIAEIGDNWGLYASAFRINRKSVNYNIENVCMEVLSNKIIVEYIKCT